MAIIGVLLPILFSTVPLILMLIGQWGVNKKAGRPGWHAIIPYLCQYTRANIGGNTKNFWIMLISSFVGIIFATLGTVFNNALNGSATIASICTLTSLPAVLLTIVMAIKIEHGVSCAFGHKIGFTLGMVFIPFLFYPILAFGKSEYQGESPEPPIKEKKEKTPKDTESPKAKRIKNNKKNKQIEVAEPIEDSGVEEEQDEAPAAKRLTMDEMMLKSLSAARKPIPVKEPPAPAPTPVESPKPQKPQNRFTIPVEYVPEHKEIPVVPKPDYLIPAFARPDYKPTSPIIPEEPPVQPVESLQPDEKVQQGLDSEYKQMHSEPDYEQQNYQQESPNTQNVINPFAFFGIPETHSTSPYQAPPMSKPIEAITPSREQSAPSEINLQEHLYTPQQPIIQPEYQTSAAPTPPMSCAPSQYEQPVQVSQQPFIPPVQTEPQPYAEPDAMHAPMAPIPTTITESAFEQRPVEAAPVVQAPPMEPATPPIPPRSTAPIRFVDPKPVEEQKHIDDDDDDEELPPPPFIQRPPKRSIFGRKSTAIDRFHNEDGGLK